jgi:hypothetical protein
MTGAPLPKADDPMTHPRRASLVHAILAAAALLVPAVSAQVQERYHAGSFEPHRFAPGRLAGHDMFTGQEAWLVTGDLFQQPLPNLDKIQVQGATVRSGSQAVHWDVSGERFEYAHLRRNEVFPMTGPYVDIDVDFRIASASQPSEAWGLHPQQGPAMDLLAWIVRPSGEVEVLRPGPPHVLVPTGFFVTRNAWHESRTTIHVPSSTWDLVIDGRTVARGIGTIVPAMFHAFTSVQCSLPGNDAITFDNFVVRERSALPFVSVDLDSFPIGARAQVRMRLDAGPGHANQSYLLLGSASGTTPGINVGPVHLPLNYDGWTAAILSGPMTPVFQNFLGAVNADARGSAMFDSLVAVPAAALGLTFHYAFVTLQPLDAVSNAVPVRVR